VHAPAGAVVDAAAAVDAEVVVVVVVVAAAEGVVHEARIPKHGYSNAIWRMWLHRSNLGKLAIECEHSLGSRVKRYLWMGCSNASHIGVSWISAEQNGTKFFKVN
jgi:hypothetical protein